MVTVRLMGGLGNQLFQYAAARALASRLQTELVLDTAGFRSDPKRTYELADWRIQARKASFPEIRRFHGRYSLSRRLFHALDACRPPGNRRRFAEKRFFAYDPEFERLSPGVYLDGYWQNPRYFSGIRELLRQEMTGTKPLSAAGQDLFCRGSQGNSVALHVRRGDYVSDPNVVSWYESCSDDYYARALAVMRNHLKQPVFFVFSDDIGFARHAFPGPDFTVVSLPGPDQTREEFQVMRACRHHVIANSSFSWWAAWLNDFPGKQVVAPCRWLRDPAFPVGDLIDPAWIALEPGPSCQGAVNR